MSRFASGGLANHNILLLLPFRGAAVRLPLPRFLSILRFFLLFAVYTLFVLSRSFFPTSDVALLLGTLITRKQCEERNKKRNGENEEAEEALKRVGG